LIKKLDILIVKSFIGPFVITFFVTLFVLVMQFFWLYMDDLIGKGLGLWMIIQLLFYMSTTMVPLALPLSILLASIMTFGNMGENFELVAIKSAGISLLRFMRPLLFFIILVGGLAFVFNNNVIPVANLKALSLLYDLTNSKPTLNIRPDEFNNEIEGYSIRVGSKDKDGRTIHNVIIYDQSSGTGNTNVILADKGTMIPDGSNLIFRLQNGWRYEEMTRNGQGDYDQMRMYFKSWDKVFDLSSFKLNHTNQDLFKGAYQMMDVNQLGKGIDSMKRTENRVANNVSAYLSPYITWYTTGKEKDGLLKGLREDKKPLIKYDTSFLDAVPDSLRTRVIQISTSSTRNLKGLMDVTAADKKLQDDNFIKFQVEWHRKFTLSFACILLFLIGAPLGAIIRKGGIGMPLVIAVAFFVVFHITSVTGEKLAKSGSLPAWMGMWMATAMLLPIAFFLINQARNDSPIFNKDWYIRLWRRFKTVFAGTKK
jgi:lipopolysaccharide export system permease protein